MNKIAARHPAGTPSFLNLGKSPKKSAVAAVLILLVVLFPLLLEQRSVAAPQSPVASQGVLDLSGWDFEKDGVVDLEGEWEFYWEQLLDPAEFLRYAPAASDNTLQPSNTTTGAPPPELTGYHQVPGNWTGTLNGPVGDTSLSPRGYATYRLVVKNIDIQGTLGLKKTNIRSSAKLFVNGELVHQDGKPASNLADYEFSNRSSVAFAELPPGDLELIIQVANFDNIQGGITNAIQIGTQERIQTRSNRNIILESAQIVALLLIGLTYLLAFFIARSDEEDGRLLQSFFFICISVALFSSLQVEKPFLLLFPHLDFRLAFRLLHLSSLISIASVVMLVEVLGKGIVSKKVRNVALSLLAIPAAAVLALPLHVYLQAEWFIILCYGIFSAYVLVQGIRYYYFFPGDPVRKRAAGHLLALITANTAYNLNVLFYIYGWVDNINFANLCLILFAGLLVVLLIRRLYLAQKRNLQISLELALREQEIAARENAFLRSQINPHFLYNTLSTIISFCYTDSRKAGDLLNEFSNYLRQSFDPGMLASTVPLAEELTMTESYVKIQQARFGDRIRFVLEVDTALRNVPIPAFTIQPLVENAIRHGILKKDEGGTVRVRVVRGSVLAGHGGTVERPGSILIVEVMDDGVGMDEAQMDWFSRKSGQGIGLDNIRKRLWNEFITQLHVESTSDAGTRVWYQLELEDVEHIVELGQGE